MIQIAQPFQNFVDTSGEPLNNGYVYIGTAAQNPETNAIAVYWDSALTIPAAQPIRTVNGYLARNGSPARLYTSASSYSITVRDSNRAIVVTALDASTLDTLRADLAAPSGASLVGYLPAGSGGVPTTVEAKLNAIEISAADYGADSTGATDGTAAVQKAIDALPALGGTVRIAGTTKCTSSLSITGSKTVIFRGDGRQATTLKYTGNTLFISQTGTGDLGFVDITVSGTGVTTGPIAVVGSICYQSANNSYSKDAQFIFWATISTWQAGYYHKHWNTYFNYFKDGFYGYSQNNLNFFGCRWSTFESGIIVNAGEGPIGVFGGSVENVGKYFCSPIAGAKPCITFNGVYVEQSPATATPSGITSTGATGFFNAGGLALVDTYPISLFGCIIFTPGFLNMVYFGSASGGSINSIGNVFVNRGLGTGVTIYANGGGGPISGILQDTFDGAMGGGGVYTSASFGAAYAGCNHYDPVALKMVQYSPITLVTVNANGWTNPSSDAGYLIAKDGRVTLRGSVSGTTVTSGTIFTLPAALCPSAVKFFTVTYGSDSIGVIRITTGGLVYWDNYGSVNSPGAVYIDPVSFYPGT